MSSTSWEISQTSLLLSHLATGEFIWVQKNVFTGTKTWSQGTLRWLPGDTQALDSPKAEGVNNHPFQGERGYIFSSRAFQSIPRGGGESSRQCPCLEERATISLDLKVFSDWCQEKKNLCGTNFSRTFPRAKETVQYLGFEGFPCWSEVSSKEKKGKIMHWLSKWVEGNRHELSIIFSRVCPAEDTKMRPFLEVSLGSLLQLPPLTSESLVEGRSEREKSGETGR